MKLLFRIIGGGLIVCGAVAAAVVLQACSPNASAVAPAGSAAANVSPQIIVDGFGWRASAARKVAIFADPQKGQNASQHYTPGGTFEIRQVKDGKTVYTGKVAAWQNGKVQETSGDKVWQGDFSDFKTPGKYVIYDPANKAQSVPFTVGDDAYAEVLKVNTRTYFYQRCGVAIAAKYGGNWTHDPCHMDDPKAELYTSSPQGKPRDVSGGWHDAGDYNRYVPFVSNVMWDLLSAYELNPKAFTDTTNIPESGNGVPDLLDEIKWETDWLLKMQTAEGSVNNRVSQKTYDNGTGPDKDRSPRYYTQPTTWATATFAASTAHAATVFAGFEKSFPGYAARLTAAAERAWAYLEKTPKMTPADGTDGASLASAPGSATAEADARARVFAAAELYRATGKPVYKAYFESNYKDKAHTKDGNNQPMADGQFDPSLCPELVRASFDYARTKGATPAIVAEIKTVFKNTMENNLVPSYVNGEDAYRAFMWDGHYCWGSNQMKGNWAKLAILAASLEVNPTHTALYREIAEEYLHYLHGRNPLSWVYLSNMGSKGAGLTAGKSPMRIYHGWFQTGSPLYDGAESKFGPAPGFVPGGPNQFFTKAWISPPHGEPPMKAYRDWNAAWNKEKNDGENSWEVTEPAIYYQAAYTFLVSAFVAQ